MTDVEKINKYIPLLSGKPLCEFTPEDFKAHVRALFYKKEKRKSPPKPKKEKPPFVWSLTKKGNLTIKINRKPKWLSREEIDLIAVESGIPANEVWLKVMAKKSGVLISTQAEQDRIALELEAVPL